MTSKLKNHAWLDSILILLLTAVLVWPLFRLKYLDNFPSIESTFIADARMLNGQLPHPGWQPLWYCGTRFDYIYPPALRYGTVLIARAIGSTMARAYHLYTAIYYVLGIVAVYWLVRIGSGSRAGALLAAAGVALVSPSFFLLPIIRHDSGFWIPQRLHVLMTYGEGPHISAVCVLPAALAVTFLALRTGKNALLAAAGALCALVVSNNFYGATSLAICFPLIVWAVWLGNPGRWVLLRAMAIPVLAYSLCAFWLTPSYLRITTVNLRWVALPGTNGSRLILLLAIAMFCAVTWHFGKNRPDRAWTIFISGACLLFSMFVLGFYYFGLRIIGDSPRLIPELDLALIFVIVEMARALWRRTKLRVLAVILVLAVLSPAAIYLRHAHSAFPRVKQIEDQYQYTITKWVHDYLPGERVMPVGTVRFWFDAWFDNAQLDGGSAQGMMNQTLMPAQWEITKGANPTPAIRWLQAFGVDAVIVPSRASFEPYRDYIHPQKFVGSLEPLYDDQHGTVIYRIARLHPSIGRVVNTARLASVGPVGGGDDVDTLKKYINVVEYPVQEPVSVQWSRFDEVHVNAQAGAGESVLLQETYDPAWHAYENGKQLAIHADPLTNFMVIDTTPGSHQIDLRFETPLENRIGQGLFVLGVAAVVTLVVRRRRQGL